MISLSGREAEDVLKWFFKETKERSAVRLHSVGGIIYSQVPDHPLRCYLQAVLCYSLGCFDACIAVVSMATEFHLKERIKEDLWLRGRAVTKQNGPRNPKRQERRKKELLRKMEEDRTTYGELIELARILKVLASELPRHEAINGIRSAYLHKSAEKLRKLHRKEIETIAGGAPEPEQEGIKNHLARLYAELYPKAKALEAVKRAGEILAPRINQDPSPFAKYERYHQSLFRPLLHENESTE
jgi:hypothetical protein